MKMWLIVAKVGQGYEIHGARLSEAQARREADAMNKVIKKEKYNVQGVEVR